MNRNTIERAGVSDVTLSEQFTPPKREKVLPDYLFLAGVVLLLSVLYIRGLGFYGPDWNSIRILSMASDQSLYGLFEAGHFDPKR